MSPQLSTRIRDNLSPASRKRQGQTNPVLIVLLGVILVALIVLIVLMLTRGGGNGPSNGDGTPAPPSPSRPDAEPGEVVDRENLPEEQRPSAPEPIRDPDRIQETAQAGKTYRNVVKAGFTARVEDKDWGIQQVTNVAYASEFVVNRTIESNDGQKIVERRHFEAARSTKLLFEVEEVTIELGQPGVAALAVLEALAPGAASAAITAKPVAEAILGIGAQAVGEHQATQAFAQVESISGKEVRITYVDGVGVTSLEPIDCSLTAEEQDLIFGTALLSDYYMMPDLEIEVGGTWSVDGRHFSAFFDPSWNGTPSGTVVIVRDSDSTTAAEALATLRIDRGTIELDASDYSKRRVGSFTPRGRLEYSLQDRFVKHAYLDGAMRVEELSKDHLLFEARFRTQPKLEIVYSCEIQ